MEEDEIDTEPIVVDANSALTADERKVISQLKQEIGEVPQRDAIDPAVTIGQGVLAGLVWIGHLELLAQGLGW
jgi:hypothetical protein